MKQFLLWLWQFPQNLIGFCLTRFRKQTLLFMFNDGTTGRIYFTNNVFGCGVSLGNYIILDYKTYWKIRYYNSVLRTYNHEHGHQKQSLKLGWLYLPTIGILSAYGNIVDRVMHKYHKNGCWYYKQPWEKWADKLGQVQR